MPASPQRWRFCPALPRQGPKPPGRSRSSSVHRPGGRYPRPRTASACGSDSFPQPQVRSTLYLCPPPPTRIPPRVSQQARLSQAGPIIQSALHGRPKDSGESGKSELRPHDEPGHFRRPQNHRGYASLRRGTELRKSTPLRHEDRHPCSLRRIGSDSRSGHLCLPCRMIYNNKCYQTKYY